MSHPQLSQPTLFTPKMHLSLLPAFTHLHQTCISSPPYPILTFLPPFPAPKIRALESWWRDRFNEVVAGTRHILFVTTIPTAGETIPKSEEKEVKIAGVCMLSTPQSETGPHRGFVEKFLVDPMFRGRGVGTGIMRGIEEVARERGAWLLVCVPWVLIFGDLLAIVEC
ncbi:hypothetical protein OCU04_006535 [Sclerotinia nivalis]|uniref:N-acetyltransferase domain-containing protein n=1 Tax=Sclerotinia nivalis TaxID=352851 RepID=A0A9X0AJY2_9HELO|nr:hypothetical protein OCU04_006535 [Sclerotinia nivalis]